MNTEQEALRAVVERIADAAERIAAALEAQARPPAIIHVDHSLTPMDADRIRIALSEAREGSTQTTKGPHA